MTQSLLDSQSNPQQSPQLDPQRAYLDRFIVRYTQRTQTSKAIAQFSRSVLADPRQSEWFSPTTKELCYLVVGERSQGSRVWDVNGNEYIDLIMGFGANLLGHNPPLIKEALQAQLEKGIQLGPQAEYAGEVAALISELTGLERVAFSNTGTEAVMTAVRLARAATQRTKIAVFTNSYHGHADGVLVEPGFPLPSILQRLLGGLVSRLNARAVPMAPGIPKVIAKNVLVLDYGNPESLQVIKAHRHQLAAVLVEPVQSQQPDLQPKAFLHDLRSITQDSGIALIFDEMVTGFRLHLGGAQAWFGVEADIATYGKVVGGGLPIGVIGGKAAYLDKIDGGQWAYGDDSYPSVEKTFFAGTHCKHPLSMAAARALLHHLKQQGPTLQEQLNQRTACFVEQFNAFLAVNSLPIQMAHFGSFFSPVFRQDASPCTISALMPGFELLRYHLLDRGILLRGEGGGFLSTAHTDDDINAITQAMKDSIAELQSAGFFPTS
ncbi:aspartate aminotransferase family protein [Acaryochloris marina]|uniref:Aminotransferase, class III n=1 Tax=Acaryochloris marina (strain MBIC 11017) TaxID=329726 RepID=A8ZKP3_ACAM1|nr:aspartate aminotransferase family protein [Acaryochloris marina]ABW31361.1 aminotransferase, class III [Acaryochloris marina MBIC11017]